MKLRLLSTCMFAAAGLATAAAMAANQVKIVDEGRLPQNGITSDSTFAPPGFPATLATSGDSVCVSLGYKINADGTTTDFGVLKSWSSSTEDERPKGSYWDDVINVSAQAVSDWKFKKADGSTLAPVYTAATFSFRGKQPMEASQLRANCLITDLTAHIQDIKSKRYRSGQPDTFTAEQFRRQSQGQRSMVSNPGAGSAATP